MIAAHVPFAGWLREVREEDVSNQKGLQHVLIMSKLKRDFDARLSELNTTGIERESQGIERIDKLDKNTDQWQN